MGLRLGLGGEVANPPSPLCSSCFAEAAAAASEIPFMSVLRCWGAAAVEACVPASPSPRPPPRPLSHAHNRQCGVGCPSSLSSFGSSSV